MDEKKNQARLSDESNYLDISDLSPENQRMMWSVYEFLLRKEIIQRAYEEK